MPFLQSILLVGGEGKQRTFFDSTFSGMVVSGISLVKSVTFPFLLLVIVLLLLSLMDNNDSNVTNTCRLMNYMFGKPHVLFFRG